MALLSISSEWTEVQVRVSLPCTSAYAPHIKHIKLPPRCQIQAACLQCVGVLTHRTTHTPDSAHAHQVPAAIWSFLELFGEWGGTWTLLLDLTALVVLVNYHTALFAQKGHRGLREATTWREQPRQKPRKMSPQPEDQGDVGMQV